MPADLGACDPENGPAGRAPGQHPVPAHRCCLKRLPDCSRIGTRQIARIVGAAWHPEGDRGRQAQKGTAMKTVMGWIDKIVSSLAKRKVNKDEGRANPR